MRPHTGRLKIPTVYSPPCVPVPPRGVQRWRHLQRCDRQHHQLVYYQPPAGWSGRRRSRARRAPTPRALATAQAYVAMFNHLYEMYGRHVNLIPFTASGADTDPVAAHADAVTVAQQNSTPSPPSAAPVRPPPTRTSWPASTYCAWAAATRPPTARSRRTSRSSGPTSPPPTPRSTRLSGTSLAKLNGKDAVWAGDPPSIRRSVSSSW